MWIAPAYIISATVLFPYQSLSIDVHHAAPLDTMQPCLRGSVSICLHTLLAAAGALRQALLQELVHTRVLSCEHC